MSGDEILGATGLHRGYAVRQGVLGRDATRKVQAVAGVDLAVRRGETLAIVGESGCGKSTLARLLLGLERPDAGQVWFEGADLAAGDARMLRSMRRKLQLIFQDPFASLNPRMTAGELIEEPLIVHRLGHGAERVVEVRRMADLVGLPAADLERYPHEFSGGQRQRIAIARALVCGPDLVIGDEPVSALDVSVRAQVINLLADLKEQLRLTLVIITHDLGVVRHMADRVGVMYLGRLVELAPTGQLFAAARHPYTQALLDAVPRADPTAERRRPVLEGDLPSPLDPPPGCRFHTRCPHAEAACRAKDPELVPAGEEATVACLRWRDIPGQAPLSEGLRSRQLETRLQLWAAARAAQDGTTTPSTMNQDGRSPA